MGTLAISLSNVRIVKTSELLGAVRKVNLDTGLNFDSSTPPDDGPAITAFLSSATAASPVVLEHDCACLTSGVFGAAAGYWSIHGQGPSTGFFQKAGTNDDVIHNGGAAAGNPFDPGSFGLPSWFSAYSPTLTVAAAPARGANVSLRNFRINGNRGTYTSSTYNNDGNSTTGNSRGLAMTSAITDWWYCGINLTSLDNIVLEDLVVNNTSSYGIKLGNVGNVAIRDCHVHTVPSYTALNCDGLHFSGVMNDVHVSGGSILAGDDCVAFNSPEGWMGLQERIVFDGVTFLGGASLARFYANAKIAGTPAQVGSIQGVTFKNCVGTTAFAFLFGLETAYTRHSNADNISDILIEGNSFTTTNCFAINDPIGTLTVRNNIWHPVGSGAGMFNLNFNGITIGCLALSGNIIKRDASGHTPTALIDTATDLWGGGSNTGTHAIEVLIVDGETVQDPTGSSFTAVPFLFNLNSTTTIESLVLLGVDQTKIADLIAHSQRAQVVAISGPGADACGWALPDAAIQPGTSFLSATTAGAYKKNVPGVGLKTYTLV